MRSDEIKQYLHEIVWDNRVPGKGYDVDRMAQAAAERFSVLATDEGTLEEMAVAVANSHCPECGSQISPHSRECYCCAWVRPQG